MGLATRWETAPAVDITACNQIAGAPDVDLGDFTAALERFKPGQRVRWVLDDEGEAHP
jgi:hypothetical protein